MGVPVWADSFQVLLKSKGSGFLSRFRTLPHNEPYFELTRLELRHRGHGDVLDAAVLVRGTKRRRTASKNHSIPAELHHQLGRRRHSLISVDDQVKGSVGETTLLSIEKGSNSAVDPSLSFMERTTQTLLIPSAVESGGIIRLLFRALIL